MLDICQADTDAKRVRFHTRMRATAFHVAGDLVRLQQVFWNLVRNAVKFTPGSGEITVITRNLRRKNGEDNPDIVISVTEQGSA